MIRCEVWNQIFLPQTVDGVIFFYIEFLWRAVKKNCVFLEAIKWKLLMSVDNMRSIVLLLCTCIANFRFYKPSFPYCARLCWIKKWQQQQPESHNNFGIEEFSAASLKSYSTGPKLWSSGKGKDKESTQEVDCRLSIIDCRLSISISLKLYTKVGCHLPPPPASLILLN